MRMLLKESYSSQLTEVKVKTKQVTEQQQAGYAYHDRHKGYYKETS